MQLFASINQNKTFLVDIDNASTIEAYAKAIQAKPATIRCQHNDHMKISYENSRY